LVLSLVVVLGQPAQAQEQKTAKGKIVSEQWFTIELQGQHAGYTHEVFKEIDSSNNLLYRNEDERNHHHRAFNIVV